MVRATRNPSTLNRNPAEILPRIAERRYLGPLPQEPPRNTRWEQSPVRQALPSAGAPE